MALTDWGPSKQAETFLDLKKILRFKLLAKTHVIRWSSEKVKPLIVNRQDFFLLPLHTCHPPPSIDQQSDDLAWAETSACTISTWPFRAAMWSGVVRLLLDWFTSATPMPLRPGLTCFRLLCDWLLVATSRGQQQQWNVTSFSSDREPAPPKKSLNWIYGDGGTLK